MIPRMSEDRRGHLLSELGRLAAEIDAVEEVRDDLYRYRLELLREARDMRPPILQRVLADVCGVSDPAINQQLKKMGT